MAKNVLKTLLKAKFFPKNLSYVQSPLPPDRLQPAPFLFFSANPSSIPQPAAPVTLKVG